MSIAAKCTCGCSLTGVCTSSVKECNQLINMENNTQLPGGKHFLNWLSGYRNENGEYIELLKGKYYFVDEYPDDDIYHTEVTADELIELYKLHHPVEATAYASKLHQVEQENADLRRQNDKMKQQATGWRPMLEDALRENNHTAMYPDHFINKIKKFLYGE